MTGRLDKKADHGVFGDFRGQVLDGEGEIARSEHARPHWMQVGTITFITMRLADSIPAEVIKRWDTCETTLSKTQQKRN